MKFTRSMKKTVALPLVTFVALATALAACSPTPEGDGGQPSSDGTVEYLSAAAADVAKLDPAFGTTSGQVGTGALWIAIYDTLVNIAPDGTLEPRLASGVEANDDWTTWTVTLRSDLMFSDDTPLDAEAVATHWKRLATPDVGSPAQGLASTLTNIEVIDAESVQVTLAQPDAHWPDVLATSALGLIPSPTAVEEHGEKYGTSADSIVGAGPFVVESWKRDDRVTLDRSDSYWNASEVGPGEVLYRYIADASLRTKNFIAGEGDIIAHTVPGQDLVDLRKDYIETTWDAVGALSVALNTRPDRATSSQPLREALAAGLDIASALQRSAPGTEPITSLFPESSPYHEPTDMPFGDPAAAQTLLDEYLADTQQESATLVLVTNQQYSGVAQAFKQDWDKLDGLNVEIQVEQSLLPRLSARDFDLIFSAFGGGTPHALVDRLLSTAKATNVTGIADTKLDDALLRYLNSADTGVVGDALSDVQGQVVSELPYLPLFSQIGSNFSREKDLGVTLLTDGAVDFAALKVQ